jgi:hypothetical protein
MITVQRKTEPTQAEQWLSSPHRVVLPSHQSVEAPIPVHTLPGELDPEVHPLQSGGRVPSGETQSMALHVDP